MRFISLLCCVRPRPRSNEFPTEFLSGLRTAVVTFLASMSLVARDGQYGHSRGLSGGQGLPLKNLGKSKTLQADILDEEQTCYYILIIPMLSVL